MASQAILDRLMAIVEPSSTVNKDNSGTEPDEWRPNTLYAFSEDEDAVVNDETGPARLLRFQATLVYIADALDEEPTMERDAGVSDLLSSKRDDYLLRIADFEAIDLWDHVEGVADMDWITTFEGRAVAVRVSGYKYLS